MSWCSFDKESAVMWFWQTNDVDCMYLVHVIFFTCFPRYLSILNLHTYIIIFLFIFIYIYICILIQQQILTCFVCSSLHPLWASNLSRSLMRRAGKRCGEKTLDWNALNKKQTKLKKTRWWFQICFILIPIWGRFPFWLYNIFQMGWNYQPEPNWKKRVWFILGESCSAWVFSLLRDGCFFSFNLYIYIQLGRAFRCPLGKRYVYI